MLKFVQHAKKAVVDEYRATYFIVSAYNTLNSEQHMEQDHKNFVSSKDMLEGKIPWNDDMFQRILMLEEYNELKDVEQNLINHVLEYNEGHVETLNYWDRMSVLGAIMDLGSVKNVLDLICYQFVKTC